MNKAALGALGLVILWLLLRPVFSGDVILPQTLSLGWFQLRYYGLILTLALIAAYWLAVRRASAYHVSRAQLDQLVVWIVVVVGFIGARLYHVLTDSAYYLQYPGQIFAVWQGGLSIFGAVIGGVVGLWLGRRRAQLHATLWELLDWLAPSVLVAQIIGRFGNLFNYEIFGRATNLPWRMFVPAQFRPELWADFSYFHPLFLYEAVLNSLILVILLGAINKKRHRPGVLFLSYLFLYNAVRFFLEWYRIDTVFIGRVPFNAIVAGSVALISLLVLLLFKHERVTSSHI